MKVSKAGKIWLDYHQIHSKKNTVRTHSFVKDKFCSQFGDYKLNDLSVDNILDFMNQITEGRKPQTKRVRFTNLLAFLNFAKKQSRSGFHQSMRFTHVAQAIPVKDKDSF